MKAKCITICLLSTALWTTTLSAQSSVSTKPNAHHIMGNYPCAWWSPVDLKTKDVVDGLEASKFHCGAFLIQGEEGPNSYPQFRELLKATRDKNIDIWAVILPPSEGANSYPYRKDYVGWSKEFATLSLKYRNFRGFNIDDTDMRESQSTFTHEYFCEIYRAKQAINPSLAFVPTLYDLGSGDADRVAGCVDGVWLWWVNLEKNLGLRSALTNARAMARGRFPVYGGVYAHSTSWHTQGQPDAKMFTKILDTSCKYSDGVVIWLQSLDPADPILKVTKTALPGGNSEYAGKCGQGASGDGK